MRPICHHNRVLFGSLTAIVLFAIGAIIFSILKIDQNQEIMNSGSVSPSLDRADSSDKIADLKPLDANQQQGSKAVEIISVTYGVPLDGAALNVVVLNGIFSILLLLTSIVIYYLFIVLSKIVIFCVQSSYNLISCSCCAAKQLKRSSSGFIS
ncbi:hypothetical protein MDAP_000332 [Mitosporidium daphniae]